MRGHRPVVVLTVLRSGGEYTKQHVLWLKDSFLTHWPKTGPMLRFACLTDTPLHLAGVEEVPMVGRWPGWWSKMELFRPDLFPDCDLLYADLDTVVVGDPTVLLDGPRRPTILRDFYHRNKPERQGWMGSGLMLLPAGDPTRTDAVWARWIRGPATHMANHSARGDQGFLMACWERYHIQRWQDRHPGIVASYKVHVQKAGAPPPAARVICFHGKPRPWHVAPLYPTWGTGRCAW